MLISAENACRKCKGRMGDTVMRRDVLERANKLTAEIARLNKEIIALSGKRRLRKYKFEAGSYVFCGFETELTEDDIKALIGLRIRQVEKLEKELRKL